MRGECGGKCGRGCAHERRVVDCTKSLCGSMA